MDSSTDEKLATEQTNPLRLPVALALLLVNLVWLLISLEQFLIPREAVNEFDSVPDFAERSRQHFLSFAGLWPIILPLIAVLLVTHFKPVLATAKLVVVLALGQYAFSALFALITFVGAFFYKSTYTDSKGTTTVYYTWRSAVEDGFERIGALVLLAIVMFVVVKIALPLLRGEPKPDRLAAYGQGNYSQQQGFGQASHAQPGYGQPAYGQQPSYGPQGQPQPAGYPQGMPPQGAQPQLGQPPYPQAQQPAGYPQQPSAGYPGAPQVSAPPFGGHQVSAPPAGAPFGGGQVSAPPAGPPQGGHFGGHQASGQPDPQPAWNPQVSAPPAQQPWNQQAAEQPAQQPWNPQVSAPPAQQPGGWPAPATAAAPHTHPDDADDEQRTTMMPTDARQQAEEARQRAAREQQQGWAQQDWPPQ